MTPGRIWAASIATIAILAAWGHPEFYLYYAALAILLATGAVWVVAFTRGAEIDDLRAELERRDREDLAPWERKVLDEWHREQGPHYCEDHPRLHAAVEDMIERWRSIAERNRSGGSALPKAVAAAQRAMLLELTDILAAADEDTPPPGLTDRMVDAARDRTRLRVVPEQRDGGHDHLKADDDWFARLYDDKGNPR